jgi:aryl-alcohol dehydrogenase-like predicted oxidoreductase
LGLSPEVDAVQVPGSLLNRRFEDARVASTGNRAAVEGDSATCVGCHRRFSVPQSPITFFVCVRYTLGVNGVTCLLLGVDTLGQRKENVALIQQGAMPSEIHQEIAQALPLLPADYLCPVLWPR